MWHAARDTAPSRCGARVSPPDRSRVGPKGLSSDTERAHPVSGARRAATTGMQPASPHLRPQEKWARRRALPWCLRQNQPRPASHVEGRVGQGGAPPGACTVHQQAVESGPGSQAKSRSSKKRNDSSKPPTWCQVWRLFTGNRPQSPSRRAARRSVLPGGGSVELPDQLPVMARAGSAHRLRGAVGSALGAAAPVGGGAARPAVTKVCSANTSAFICTSGRVQRSQPGSPAVRVVGHGQGVRVARPARV